VLFRSAATVVGTNAVGVIMAGMGDDGARGLEEMNRAAGFTLARDEATSIVFDMPKAAIARGCVDRIVPLCSIGTEISVLWQRRGSKLFFPVYTDTTRSQVLEIIGIAPCG
jgi:chemotaxis response regulator CheB